MSVRFSSVQFSYVALCAPLDPFSLDEELSLVMTVDYCMFCRERDAVMFNERFLGNEVQLRQLPADRHWQIGGMSQSINQSIKQKNWYSLNGSA